MVHEFNCDIVKIGLNHFGKSGKKEDLLNEYGYDIPSLEEKVLEIMKGENNE